MNPCRCLESNPGPLTRSHPLCWRSYPEHFQELHFLQFSLVMTGTFILRLMVHGITFTSATISLCWCSHNCFYVSHSSGWNRHQLLPTLPVRHSLLLILFIACLISDSDQLLRIGVIYNTVKFHGKEIFCFRPTVCKYSSYKSAVLFLAYFPS
jgi:hypothetical protein